MNRSIIFNRRQGVTLVEVLTSVIVAVIGVAGVLVLIPFGIRQAQVGLDQDDATAMADNALARFEIEGYNRFSLFEGEEAMPWVNVDGEMLKLISQPFVPTTNPQNSCYWIDPLWLNRVGPAQINNMFLATSGSQMEFQGSGADPRRYQPTFLNVLNLADPFGGPGNTLQTMNLALAERMFRASDDLQFAFETAPDGTPIDELNPPQPYLDISQDGEMRRQSRGEMSWSAVAVPKQQLGIQTPDENPRVDGFDFFVLVYKDRSFENPTNAPADRDPRMRYGLIDKTQTPRVIRGVGTVVVQGGMVDLANDDWVMLINYWCQAPQVGFFRVVGSDPDTGRLTLDGNDFTFSRDAMSRAYIVHLPNVVNVYKRRLELIATDTFNFQ